MIPKHTLYAEPFTGGGAVFFEKEPSTLKLSMILIKALDNIL